MVRNNIFRIYDGRNYFWQWDTNQKLIVLDETVDEVHFSNRDMTHAISKDVFTDKDGKRVCYIPDILLTLPKNLIAAAIVTDNNANKTLKQVKFAVQKRAIPSDYVVSDDVQSEDIADRLNIVEELVEDMRLNLPNTYDAKGSAEQALADAKEYVANKYDPIGSAKDVQDKLTEEIARAKNEEAAITRALHQINDRVIDAQSDVGALEKLIGVLPNGVEVSTIVEYIDEKTEGAISDEIIRELDVRIESVENEIDTKLDDLSFVSYNEQELTDEQKSQARKNIGVTNSQSDWSVNDETNAAYIANRPFYDEVTVIETFWNNLTDTFPVTYRWPSDNIKLFYSKDELFRVTYDGVEHFCYSSKHGYSYFIGNKALIPEDYSFEGGIGDAVDTGEPFCICSHEYNNAYNFITTSEAGQHTVTVEKVDIKVHQLKTKYLPIIEDGLGVILEIKEAVNETTLEDTSCKMLLGEYMVIIDGISETVEFVEDGESSFAECERGYIETWDGGVYVDFPTAGKIHSVKIIDTRDVIKKEHLPYSVFANPDWNQNNPSTDGYIVNRPFYVDTVLNEHKLTIAEQSSDGGSSTDNTFAKLLYENYENCVFRVYSGSWLIGNIDSITTTDTELVIQLSFAQESGNTLKHTVRIANDYSYINWIRATELAGTKIRFIITTTEEVVKQIDQKYIPKDFIVEITTDGEGNYTADKTFEEIFAAYNEGRMVQAKRTFDSVEGTLYHLTYILADDQALFSNNAFAYQENLVIYPDNTIDYFELDLVVGDLFNEQINDVRSSIVQSDWSQNDEAHPSYIKNRPFYPMDESYIGSLNFTATGTNTMDYTYTSVDDVVLFYFQKLAGKGQVIKAKVNGCSGLIGVEFSRGYFSISGTMTGHFMFSPGRVWESTVSMNGISLATGETYQVEFYDTTTPGYMPLDIKYLSSKVHTDERAPIQYGTGDGSTIQNGARESSGRESHAQGNNTVARGWSAHAQGAYTEANGDHTQAEGYYTIANGTNQHVQGKFNIADDDDKYAHIVGNGTNGNARSNAHTLDWSGNAWFAGDIRVGGTGQDDPEAKTLVTTEYVQPKDVVVTLLDDGTIDIPVNDLVAEYDNGSRIVVKSQRYGQFNSVTSKDINLIILTNTRIVGDNEVEVDELELRYDFRNDVNTWRHTAKLIEEPSIVQTTGDSTTKLMSQKAVTDLLPKITNITMLAANWSGDANPWSQVVSVNGVTANSKVDLQPTAIQIVELQNDEITLMLQNDNGIITSWAIGNKPTEDYTMDVLITEVVRL